MPTILIVEDEAKMRRLLELNLGEDGFTTLSAGDAEAGLKIVQQARATGVTASPRDSSPASQRNYALTSLERFGPNRWEPYDAPKLEVRDAAGKRVALEEYRGKNVLLVFYLGQECPHCMRQLHDIGQKKDDWERLNTAVLAVSSAAPAKNAATRYARPGTANCRHGDRCDSTRERTKMMLPASCTDVGTS